MSRLTKIVFSVYLVLLTWLILFKFATSISEIPSIRNINLIPFYYDQETSVHFKEVLYNVFVFIPFGVYIQILKGTWKSGTKFLAVLGTSLLFEVIQFIFAIGSSDVTDLIGNTLGGIVGILLCVIMKKIVPEKYISIINVLGIMIEVTGIGMLALLLMVN